MAVIKKGKDIFRKQKPIQSLIYLKEISNYLGSIARELASINEKIYENKESFNNCFTDHDKSEEDY